MIRSLHDLLVDRRHLARPPFAALRARTRGAVLEPDDEGYDALVTPWNVAVPVRPACVVAAVDAQDVVATVRFARARGLTVSPQATGHGARAGAAGTVLISTAGLDECVVHPDGWARVGAGVKWGRVVEAAAPYGLAPLNGSSSDVGVVGYTTGGGVGPMARTHGLASDRVRAFEVVTGDGQLRRATATEHPELFFALRGGKGAAGIVTAVEFDLVEQPRFYGGALYFAGEDLQAVVDRWRTWSAELPLEATTSLAVLQLPPLPSVPPPLAGRCTVAVRYLWTGGAESGEARLAPLREVAPAVLDGIGEMPYAAIDAVHADPVDPMPVHESSAVLSAFTAETAQALLAVTGPQSGSPQVIVELRQLGGAVATGVQDDAYCHRDAAFGLLTIGIAGQPGVVDHAADVRKAVDRWTSGGVLPNFGTASPAEAYDAATLDRLRAVVRTYDRAGVLALGRLLDA
jgi:FAD/FMN-containing dehydrogenase